VATADGGREGPILSGYRGGLFFGGRDDDGREIQYDAITVLDDADSVAPWRLMRRNDPLSVAGAVPSWSPREG
jgi:hypothetical protein